VIPGVLGFTVNPLNDVDVPFGVVTVAVLKPVKAFGAIVNVSGRFVSDPPFEMAAIIPVPSKLTAVAPLMLKPVIVAGTVAP